MIKHIHRGLWITSGLFFILLGGVGLLLPVIPQLPFFIAAAICFTRGSKRFNDWLERQAWFDRIRQRFHQHKKR